MKKLLLTLVCLVFLSCKIMEDPPKPIHCYYIDIQVSTISGKILSTETSSNFLYEKETIDKCLCDVERGTIYTLDSISHIITIRMTAWIYPDSKGEINE